MICNCRHTKKDMQLFSSQYSLHWWVTPTAYYISRSYVGQQYWQSRPKIQFRLEYKVGYSNTFSIIPVSKYLERFCRGLLIIIWTGLNIQIGIAQKSKWVMKLFLCQFNCPIMSNPLCFGIHCKCLQRNDSRLM